MRADDGAVLVIGKVCVVWLVVAQVGVGVGGGRLCCLGVVRAP